ncbi:MAG: HEPN domain-containing protein [bacterium]
MQEHEEWLRIAKEDLLAAKMLIKGELFSAVVYHCQQSAEKSLKAYLILKKHPIIKTHDLINLLELCMSFDNEFCKKFDAANYINPFSSKFRYPTEFDIPDQVDAKLALKHAASIMKFVLEKISKQKIGQADVFDDKEIR